VQTVYPGVVFEVSVAVEIHTVVFWVMTPCGRVDG
jgi:hypothetical protein